MRQFIALLLALLGQRCYTTKAVEILEISSSEILIDLPIYIIGHHEIRLQVRVDDDVNQVLQAFCTNYGLSEIDCNKVNTHVHKHIMIKLNITSTSVNNTHKNGEVCNDRSCNDDSHGGYKLLINPTLTRQSDPFKYDEAKILDSIDFFRHNSANIVIYIHVCQCGDWMRSFDILSEALTKSRLYTIAAEIRLSVLMCRVSETTTDNGVQVLTYDTNIEMDYRLYSNDKMKIVHYGHDVEYERPTLLHIRESSFTDPANTLYLYLHTKGIRHFGMYTEAPVVDWINKLLVCNVYKWETAVRVLSSGAADTYGCFFNVINIKAISGGRVATICKASLTTSRSTTQHLRTGC